MIKLLILYKVINQLKMQEILILFMMVLDNGLKINLDFDNNYN